MSLAVTVVLSLFLLMPFVMMRNRRKPGSVCVIYSVYILWYIVIIDSMDFLFEFIVFEASGN